MPITFIGDCHGKIKQYRELCDFYPITLQLGDFGIGFVNRAILPQFDENHRVIRGNHDDPIAAKDSPLFLPDFGVWRGIFHFAGADSIDRHLRTLNWDWWPEEELTIEQCIHAIELYKTLRPEIVASHDAPQEVFETFAHRSIKNKSRTRLALQEMLDFHMPTLWVFGHHHVDWQSQIDKTMFIGLGELSTWTLSSKFFHLLKS